VSKLWKEFRWGSYHYRDPYNYRELFVATGRKGGMGRKWSQKKGKVTGRKQEMGDEMISSASTEILDWTNVLVKLSA